MSLKWKSTTFKIWVEEEFKPWSPEFLAAEGWSNAAVNGEGHHSPLATSGIPKVNVENTSFKVSNKVDFPPNTLDPSSLQTSTAPTYSPFPIFQSHKVDLVSGQPNKKRRRPKSLSPSFPNLLANPLANPSKPVSPSPSAKAGFPLSPFPSHPWPNLNQIMGSCAFDRNTPPNHAFPPPSPISAPISKKSDHQIPPKLVYPQISPPCSSPIISSHEDPQFPSLSPTLNADHQQHSSPAKQHHSFPAYQSTIPHPSSPSHDAQDPFTLQQALSQPDPSSSSPGCENQKTIHIAKLVGINEMECEALLNNGKESKKKPQ